MPLDMPVQPAAFLRTTLPLGIDMVGEYDSGRYHSIWLPDHMVSFWPDSIWTPEFTELATISPSPHRHLDGMAVTAAAAVLTTNTPLATTVIDTVRRHPSLLAQSALTISHLSKGRFILGLGSGELENTVPYGFDFRKPVSRFEESIKVIKLLWHSNGPVDFEGEFYKLEHARLDTELYEGKAPEIWTGAAGPRMLGITGREADGWWPAGSYTPEDFAAKLKVILDAGDAVGRDMSHFTPALTQICLIGEDDEIDEMLRQPMVKSIIAMLNAKDVAQFGYEHPMGPDWHGIMDFDPHVLTRERMIQFCEDLDTQMIRDIFPVGTPKQVAAKIKGFIDAGVRVYKLMEYGGMGGLRFSANSAAKVRETEDEIQKLVPA
ncbi:LLM class flavin-dependent oxidoreductase [Novosphingobium sp. 9U]|uniref:LLM class flavin-dependent oxidoreductase n=1 Tax=Novosphingobium sp. 9U TaxID=2653158 RepID=UPI0012F24EC1|nr:LLM class flavin-dependent oxidoreductase [Novosphingobium sp. 9U]VWX53138.1 Luciferase [Novosphingobium sp. 9U]